MKMKAFVLILGLFFISAAAYAAEGAAAPKMQDIPAMRARAEAGEAAFQSYFGYLYATGSAGVEQNYEEAFKWYHKAADQGYVPAQYNLGILYDEGRGVMQSTEAAYFWLSLAAASGGANAKEYGERRDEAGFKLTLKQVDDLKKRAAAWKPTVVAAPGAAPAKPAVAAAPGVVIPWFRVPPNVQKTVNAHVGDGCMIGKVEKTSEGGMIVYRAIINKPNNAKDIVKVTESGQLIDINSD